MRSDAFFIRLLARMGVRPSAAVLLLGDALALQCTTAVAVGLRWLWGDLSLSLYDNMAVLLLLGPFFSFMLGTCQSLVLPPHREVKQLFLAVSFTYLTIIAVFFMTQSSVEYSRIVILVAWCGSVFTVPMVRGRLRKWLCRQSWWGRPLVILQQGEGAQELWADLEEHPERGLRPVASEKICPTDPFWQMKVERLLQEYPRAVYVWMPCSTGSADSVFLRKLSQMCQRLIFVPLSPDGARRFWLTPRELGSSLGFLVRQNLLDARRLRTKRAIDLFFTFLGLVVVIPLGLLIALRVRCDSAGPVIYTQTRLGQGGKLIQVYKFRTMVQNADAALHAHLLEHPEEYAEWEETQKLRHDPRVTRVGAWLRKTSLDELPQLINVLRGDMSLVGPRPIVGGEISRYGSVYHEYALVKPGITGLWQVSGRNNTTYARRVWLDHYYVTNWSVWMDVWILARTIPVVLRGHGAY